ncbi:MAG: hypothetical protein FJ150_08275 [Euryarchaeota archaeon]|nr:hypothetical protein [Euryarchaeota archaeon]
MSDWKAVGIGAITTAVLTIVFALAVFPLFFLGPILGGFITIYLIREDEDWEEPKDAAVQGGVAGVIGGLIIGILFIIGFGAIGAIIGIFLETLGLAITTISIIIGIFVGIVSMLICGVLGAIGGVIGASVRERGVE